MPHLTTDDGVKLYYEETGTGTPIVFVHEFAGDYRSWEQQVRHFGRRYRCIAFNARGYPPSDVPDDRREIFAGARARRHPRRARRARRSTRRISSACRWAASRRCISASPIRDRARSLVVAGCGYGAAPDKRAQFAEEAEAAAKRFEELTAWRRRRRATRSARRACSTRTRTRAAGASSPTSSPSIRPRARRYTMRGVQKRRPSLFDLVDKMKTITVPTLIMTGDEDWPCLEPGILMKKNIPTAGAGGDAKFRPHHQSRGAGGVQHAPVGPVSAADAGTWPTRDPRAMAGTILGR